MYFFLSSMKEDSTRLECCRNQVKSFNTKQWSLEQLIMILVDEINLISLFWMSLICFISMKESTDDTIYKNYR